MTQTEDEYELVREGRVLQLVVSYDYMQYPVDDEGCPIMPKGAPMVDVTKAEILATWLDGAPLDADEMVEYAGPDYPVLDPPMTEAELRAFDEHLADKAAGYAEELHERGR
jgi:hypothetical protein